MSHSVVFKASNGELSVLKLSLTKKSFNKLFSISLPHRIHHLVYAKFDTALYALLSDHQLHRISIPQFHQSHIPIHPALAAGRSGDAAGPGQNVQSFLVLEKKCMVVVGMQSGEIRVLQPATLLHHLHSPVTHMAVNSDESHLVFATSTSMGGSETSGSSSLLWLFSLASNTLTQLELPSGAPIKCLAFSCFKQSLLSVGFDDGSVCLLDVFAGRLLKLFERSHMAPVSAIRFSPFNRYLMVSVALDKRYVLYDVEKQKTVRVVSCAQPLTSLSIHSNGILLSIGTIDGQLLLFDLSTGGKVPSITVSDSESSAASSNSTSSAAVSCTLFMYLSEKILTCASQAQQQQHKSVKSLSAAAAAPQQRLSGASAAVDQSVNYMDLFSPVGKSRPDPLDVRALMKQQSQQLPQQQIRKPPVFQSSRAAPLTKPPAAYDPVVQVNRGPSTPTPNSSDESDVKKSEVPAITGKSPVETAVADMNSDEKSVVSPRKDDAPAVVVEKKVETIAPIIQQIIVPISGDQKELESTIVRSNEEELERFKLAKEAHSKEEDLKQEMKVPDELLTTKAGDLSHKILSGIIDDCLDDLRTEIRSEIQNLHLELLAQFDRQERYIQALVAESTKEIIRNLVPALVANAHAFHLDASSTLYTSAPHLRANNASDDLNNCLLDATAVDSAQTPLKSPFNTPSTTLNLQQRKRS